MDVSPEPTIVVKTLKDFNQFLTSGKRLGDSCLRVGSARRLNFSEAQSDASSLDESRLSHEGSRKRQLESIAGFDITKKFREKDSEIVTSRAKISRLEGRLHDVEVSNKKINLERDAEVETLRRKQHRDKELIDDLQHKVKQLQSRECEAKEKAGKMKRECSTTSLDIETKMLKMQQEHLEQCSKLREEVANLQEKVLSLETEAAESSSKVTLAESHAEEVEQQLAETKQKLKEAEVNQLQSETLTLQLDQAKAKIKGLEMRQEEVESLEKKADIFRLTVQKLPVLEKELTKLKENNKFLRDSAMNIELLEEKLTSAQQQIDLLEKRCEESAYLQAEVNLYKDTLEKYENVINEELELEHRATPQELRHHLSKFKQGDQILTNGLAQLQASHKSLEDSRTSEEAQLKILKTKLEKQQRNTQQNAQLIKRLQRKLTLVTKERDSLKDILSSYESEVTINHSIVSQERITKLEGQLELYKQELQRLEGEVETSYKNKTEEMPTGQQKKEDAEKISSLEKKALELEATIAKLIHEKEVLELRLEHRALKGDYDPTKTKVLHFKDNPLSKAIENHGTELQRLQTENEALQERIRLLEQGETHDITQKVIKEAQSSKKLSELQEKIKSMKTCNKRLIEAFKRKSLEMREVMCQLTGYRVDVSGDSHYKLSSIFAESSDDYFMFEQTSERLQLLETEFSSTLEDLIDAYLHHEKSYPAFLSAVTLDLYNRRTIDRPQSSSEEDEEMEAEAENPPLSQDDDDNDLVILD
ncbi:mitotic spindle assembly checkpoint protein MAD1-like [Panulirus ornatus]|uniref:mitotic spindle assembly checkpoint protein MAD1-like n=1 Tax=Panulirus ornatus TaxID=150431 RepID=UPI003A84B4F5